MKTAKIRFLEKGEAARLPKGVKLLPKAARKKVVETCRPYGLTAERDVLTGILQTEAENGMTQVWRKNAVKLMERLKREEAVEKICKMHGVPCWNGAAEACLGYYRMGNTCEYVADQIHLTEKGGRILGQYFWGKLKNVYPIK